MENTSTETYFTRLRSVNYGLTSAIKEKDKAKSLFVQAFQILKDFSQKYHNHNNNCRNRNLVNSNNVNQNLGNTNNNTNCGNNNSNSNSNNNDEQENMEFFNMELNLLLKNMGVFFEQYKSCSDMLKGLVFLGNYVLFLQKKFAEKLEPYMKNLADFYTAYDCEESNYQTLALMAQILEFQTKRQQQQEQLEKFNNNRNHKMIQPKKNSEDFNNHNNSGYSTNDEDSSNNNNILENKKNAVKNSNNSDWINKKSFVVKIFQTDIEEIKGGEKKQNEMLKMIGVLMPHFCLHQNKIREYRLLNQMKIFMLENIKIAAQMNNKKVLGELLYSLSKITNSVKFNDKEILKHKTIEILIALVNNKNEGSQLLLFGALKLLKVFWRASIRKTAMIRQGLVYKLLSVYSVQSKLILSFIEIMFVDEQQILLEECPQFFNTLLETVYKSSMSSKIQEEEVQTLTRLLQRCLGSNTNDQTLKLDVLQSLGQGLQNFLFKQVDQQQQQSQSLERIFQNQKVEQCENQQSLLNAKISYMQQQQQTMLNTNYNNNQGYALLAKLQATQQQLLMNTNQQQQKLPNFPNFAVKIEDYNANNNISTIQ